MKKYRFLILVLIAGLLSFGAEWNRNARGKPYNLRPILTSGDADWSMSSDSDTVWTVRFANEKRDSMFIVGGVTRGVTIELFYCGYGDNSKIELFWYHGNNPTMLCQDELLDTSLASGDTLHSFFYIGEFESKYGSVMFADSIDPTAGDSVRFWVIEYDQ